MLYSKSMLVRTIGYGFLGISGTAKDTITYVWLSECVPTHLKSRAYTSINFLDATSMGVFCAYVAYVDKDWMGINLIVLALAYLALILAFICPESPRWFLVNGKREEAIRALNYMAKFNGKTNRISSHA